MLSPAPNSMTRPATCTSWHVSLTRCISVRWRAELYHALWLKLSRSKSPSAAAGADMVLDVRHVVSEDADRLFQLVRIGVLQERISDFWPVKDASKGLLRNGDISRQSTAKR